MMHTPPWLLALSLLVTSGCEDPLRSEAIASLGGEDERFEESELHRVGQPCTLCHTDSGPGEPTMSFGGTLFHRPQQGAPFPVGGFVVELTDADGRVATARSNRCGNFYLTRTRYDPVFPVYTRVLDRAGNEVATMRSPIAEEGSCGGCHIEPRGPLSAGVVDVPGDDALFQPPGADACPEPRFLPVHELPPDLRP